MLDRGLVVAVISFVDFRRPQAGLALLVLACGVSLTVIHRSYVMASCFFARSAVSVVVTQNAFTLLERPQEGLELRCFDVLA